MRSPTLSARTIVPLSRAVESIRRDPRVSSVASGSAHASASTCAVSPRKATRSASVDAEHEESERARRARDGDEHRGGGETVVFSLCSPAGGSHCLPVLLVVFKLLKTLYDADVKRRFLSTAVQVYREDRKEEEAWRRAGGGA